MTRDELLQRIEEYAPAIYGWPLDQADRIFFSRLTDEKLLRVVCEWETMLESHDDPALEP